MDCPVCQYKNLNPISTSCPSCESDLVQWSLLNEVEEQHIKNIKKRVSLEGKVKTMQKQYDQDMRKSKKRFNKLALLLLGLPLIHFICAKRPLPPIVQEQVLVVSDSMDYYIEKTDQLERQIAALKKQEIRQLDYVIQEGDRLIDLGQLFYNDPDAGYLIAEQNAVANPRRLQPGDTLKINFLWED